MFNFINRAKVFPCKMCSAHFQELLSKHSIDYTDRVSMVHSICKIHNVVNERLNKPQFTCNDAFDFWGGECGCNENKKERTDTVVTDKGHNLKVGVTDLKKEKEQKDLLKIVDDKKVEDKVENKKVDEKIEIKKEENKENNEIKKEVKDKN